MHYTLDPIQLKIQVSMAILRSTCCDIWSSHMVLVRIQIFWDMTLYHWVNGSSHFKELNAFNFKDQALQEVFLPLKM